MKYAMLIDQTKCIGCGACTVECKGKYEASFGVLRTKMVRHEIGSYPHVKAFFIKHACMHCFEAACEKVCPVKAIYRIEGKDGGMVNVDKEKCIGCGACVGACPFKVPQVDPEDKKMEKCSFCAQRVVKGKSTYCAEACPVGAIAFGEREALLAQGENRLKALQAAGRSEAALYGKDDTGVLFIINGKPENFNLPKEGFTLSAAGWQAINSYGTLAVAAALGGLGYRFICDRLEEVKKEQK